MTIELNYAATGLDPALHRHFEGVLTEVRSNAGGPLPHLIGGEPRAEGAVFERLDPCGSGRVVSSAYTADAAIVTEAVAAARGAARGWRSMDHKERVDLLRASSDVFAERLVELAAIVSAETGKTRLEALPEAQEARDLLEHYCKEMLENDGFTTPLEAPVGEVSTDVLRPFGVFAIISPFNFPVALTINMTAAALVTGNTVVVKPSDKTPRSAAVALEILGRALPAGVLNVVHGGAETGEALASAEVDGVAFTGSAEVGWGIVRKLNEGPWARPVLAEMGGQNPAIVTESADLDAAATGIARSAFGLSGQKCSACRRVVVDHRVTDQVVDRLVAEAERLTVGPPDDPATDIGPMIDEAIAKRIDAALEVAARDGNVRTGGRVADSTGNYYAPIVVTDLPAGHPLTREELFAPFITVVTVDGFDEAIDEANDIDYGLSAGIFTGQDGEVRRFLDEVEAGVIYVNRAAGATTGAWPGKQSFCGWKASGSSGKGGLGPWYLPGFMREQSRTVVVDA